MADQAARLAAVKALAKVLPARGDGASLRDVGGTFGALPPAGRGLATDLAYGVCRHQRLISHWLDQRLQKPIKPSAWPVRLALLAGIYEVWFSERPDHAVLNAWPDVMRDLKAPWASGLCNALLRKASRTTADAEAEALPVAVRCSLPDWLWESVQACWPEQAESVAQALLSPPPLTVRLSPRAQEADWRQRCDDEGFSLRKGELATHAFTLSPAAPAPLLPGFADGEISVQDEAAQLPVAQFALPEGARVLDACAAPGGKTAQLLQVCPGAHVTALDQSARRLKRVQENLDRLGVTAQVVEGDATEPDGWWDGTLFDAILIDAPCSATGVIRRQPDSKWHRRASDIPELVGLQARMLDSLWPLLKPGGELVYATCSILSQENAEQMSAFLQRHPDAREQTVPVSTTTSVSPGCQLLPETDGHDGFYFCRVCKTEPGA